MKNNVIFTIEQVDNKLIISAESVELEQTKPTMIRSNDGRTETIEFVNPPLNINTDRNKTGLDLSKYKAFPESYTIPINTKVVCIKENGYVKIGSIGVTIEKSIEPYVRWDGNEFYEESVGKDDWALESEYLAPLDPSVHPDYKDEPFDEDKEMPMSAEGIAQWVNDFDEFDLTDDLTKHINALVQYEVNKAKR